MGAPGGMGAPGAAPGGDAPAPGGGPPSDPADALLAMVAGEAGGPPPGAGAAPTPEQLREEWDESKHKRDHGKFAPKDGAAAGGEPKDGGAKAGTAQPSSKSRTVKYPAGWKADKQPDDPKFQNRPNDHAPDEARPELSLDEANAVRDYTDTHVFGPLNEQARAFREQLRAGKEPAKRGLFGKLTGGKDLAGTHEKLKAVFAKAKPIRPPVVVKRGITVEDPAAFAKWFAGHGEAGSAISLPGYQSTSLIHDGAADTFGEKGRYGGNVQFHIHATHGIDVKPYSRVPGEDEMLLPHGSNYKVGRVEQRGGEWHVELFQVHPAASEGAAK